MLRFRESVDDDRLRVITNHVKNNGKTVVEGYKERVVRAEALFHYQPVYDPNTKKVRLFMEANILDGAGSGGGGSSGESGRSSSSSMNSSSSNSSNR